MYDLYTAREKRDCSRAKIQLSRVRAPLDQWSSSLRSLNRWIVGCSYFYFFHILRYNHPSLHPKGPRIWKLAKKIFQLHAWPEEIFGKNRKMRLFGMISKFNFRSSAWQIFIIFSACFIYGILNTHTKF
jgi:hypothetical protein